MKDQKRPHSKKVTQMTFFGNDMIIQRNKYLNGLIGWKHTDLIKIITGIRRCGKSFLLFTLFHQHLLENGTDEDHIIEIALDDISQKKIQETYIFQIINKIKINKGEISYKLGTSKFLFLSLLCDASMNT